MLLALLACRKLLRCEPKSFYKSLNRPPLQNLKPNPSPIFLPKLQLIPKRGLSQKNFRASTFRALLLLMHSSNSQSFKKNSRKYRIIKYYVDKVIKIMRIRGCPEKTDI